MPQPVTNKQVMTPNIPGYKTRAELKDILSKLKNAQKKIVFTNGCFDILHRGHTTLLKQAKSFGDILVVAINTDSSVKKLKGPKRPINSLNDRAGVLTALEVVDFVTSFSEADPLNIIKELKPDVLVKGGDWKPNKIVGGDFVASYGGKVKTVPYLKGYSTNSLIKRCYR